MTTGQGWVLSVPRELLALAHSSCSNVSFEQIARDGDPVLQAWYDARQAGYHQERPGRRTYSILDDIAASLPLRGWSHYHFHYAARQTWRGAREDDRVVYLRPECHDLWRQWESWPGDFCRLSLAEHFEVCEAFAYTVDGRIVSVAQVQAQIHERTWEVGADTLEGFRRRGYATEAVRAATAWILSRDRIPFYYYDHYNRASAAVPRKLGYFRHLEGIFCHRAPV